MSWDILPKANLQYFLQNIKAIIPTKTSDLTNDSGYTNNIGTITGITMNGSSKGTSGVVDLGTVVTDVSGKADKSSTVSNVAYDTTNKKITKTINGTTSDVVAVSTLKSDMQLTKSDVGLENVGNFKAVSTSANQGLTDTEKSNARANIDTPSNGDIASTQTVSGNPVTVNDAAPINAEDITVDITPVQLGSGTPSPDNIRPIEGRTGAELDRVGKNWLNYDDNTSGYNNQRCSSSIINNEIIITATGTDCYIGLLNTAYSDAYFAISPCKEGDVLKLVVSNNLFSKNYVTFFNKNNEIVGALDIYLNNFTVPKGAVKMGFRIGYELSVSGTTYKLKAMIVKATETDSTYEPYQGQQYTASFGEVVHGGKWHVTKGGTDKTHGNIASYNGETINEPWLSSMDEYVAGATPTIGAQVVYPLTTPTAISTPKQNVPMLKGINTVYADCGDTQLKYQPDNVVGELKGEIQVANSFVDKMALRQGSGAKDFSYGGWSFRIRIFRSMGQISLYVENISASNVTEQAIVKVFMGDSDYRAPEELRPRMNIVQAATYTTPSGWAIQVYLKDDGYIMFTGIAPEVGASAPTSSNWNLVEPWAAHFQAMDLFNN